MARVIVIANQKGGVGKTTTAIHLSASLACSRAKTLLLDLDPQGNATSGIGLDKNSLELTLYDALINDSPMADIIHESQVKNLHVIPADKHLAGAEVELVELPNRENRLRVMLEPIRDRYDYVIVDSPPSLSLLTINGLAAADSVLIPLQCEYFALEGLSELLQTIILVRDNINPDLKLQGVLLTMFQRTKLSRQVIADVRTHLGDKVYKTIIPRNVTLGEAPSFGKPVMFYDAKCAGALAYTALTKEILAHN